MTKEQLQQPGFLEALCFVSAYAFLIGGFIVISIQDTLNSRKKKKP